MNQKKIYNLGDPENDSDAVTKSYADTHYLSGSGDERKGPKGDQGDIGGGVLFPVILTCLIRELPDLQPRLAIMTPLRKSG